MHTVNETSTMLGISPATLRRWAGDAAGVLPDFRPQLTPRQFSPADVTALAGLLELARQHPELSRAEIARQVSAEVLTLPQVTSLQPAPARPPTRAEAPSAAAFEALTAQVATLQTAIEALTAQLQTLTQPPPPQLEPPKPPPPPLTFWLRLRAWFAGPQE